MNLNLVTIEKTDHEAGSFYGAPLHKHLKLLDLIYDGSLSVINLEKIEDILNSKSKDVDSPKIIY